jgi:outer membrane murein-binding lipoprotein Lpp
VDRGILVKVLLAAALHAVAVLAFAVVRRIANALPSASRPTVQGKIASMEMDVEPLVPAVLPG